MESERAGLGWPESSEEREHDRDGGLGLGWPSVKEIR